jgi:hypothetical protein
MKTHVNCIHDKKKKAMLLLIHISILKFHFKVKVKEVKSLCISTISTYDEAQIKLHAVLILAKGLK